MIQTQFCKILKVARSDNGSAFFNCSVSDFFASYGIVHQSRCVATPQQNGIVERKHHHLLEVARSLQFQANIPIKYWGHCITVVCYLINLTPSTVLKNKEPFELSFGRAPTYDHLWVFVCLRYATTLGSTDKFVAQSIPTIFLGYSTTRKGYNRC